MRIAERRDGCVIYTIFPIALYLKRYDDRHRL